MHAKLTQINAAKKAKMAQGTLAELEQEGQGSSYTAQLAEIYGVNPNWLATGKGKMLATNEHDPKLVNDSSQKLIDDREINQQENSDLNDVVELVRRYQQATRAARVRLMKFARSL